MNNLETTKVNNAINPFKNNILYWYRYVDDIICLFKGNENEQIEFLTYLNSISKNITFTMESQNKQINFLDLTIIKNKDKHSFKIFRKQTQSDLIIPANSNNPWSHKMAAFRSMINRLTKIPMDKISYQQELKTIKELATKNGYKPNMIDTMIKRMKKKSSSENDNREETTKDYICIPHNTILNKATRKTFSKKFKIAYRTKNNAFNLINNYTKSDSTTTITQNIFNKSGVYKLTCDDCTKCYIGQTGRSFKCRFNEHIQALRSYNSTTMKSTYADHLLTENHNYTNITKNMNILRLSSKGERLNSVEEFEIYKHYKQNSLDLLNTMQTNKTNPIFDKILQLQTKK